MQISNEEYQRQLDAEYNRLLDLLHHIKTVLGLRTLDELALKLDVTRANLYRWCKEGMPAKRALQIEALTKEAGRPVSRKRLAPWLYS